MPQVVTYCRVSSDEQAQKDISIPAQRKALRRWVDDRPDQDLVYEFEDKGESAYAPADKRPGFCEMISYCRRNDIDTILVHKLDRFSRNREESIIFKGLLRRNGVQVQSITENYDADTPQGFLYEGMIEVINQFYSMNLATETLKGMRENSERGFHNGGRVPYGYRLAKVTEGGREKSKLVPGPDEEVAVIREMFEMAANRGKGAKSIANALNGRGIRAPRSRHWNSSTIDSIVNNRVYTGDQVWFRSKRLGRSGRERTSEEDWIVTADTHEALVDRELFDKRKAKAKTRRFDVTRSPGKHVSYLLSRLMRCGCCGNNFVGRRQKRKNKAGEVTEYYRYYCGGYLSKGPSVCPSLPINREWAEEVVLDLLRARLCGDGTLDKLERRVHKRIEARRQAYGTDPKAVQGKLDELERQIQNYYRAIGQGMDIAICQQHIAELTQKKEVMESESKVLLTEDYYDMALEQNIAELRRFATAFDSDFDELALGVKRDIVLKFIEEIVVADRKKLKVRLRVPFDNNGIKLLTDGLLGEAEVTRAENGEDAAMVGLSEKFLSGPIGGAISQSAFGVLSGGVLRWQITR